MHLLHTVACVFTRSTSLDTNLFLQLLLQPCNIDIGEVVHDARIIRNAIQQPFHHPIDSRLRPQILIKAIVCRWRTSHTTSQSQEKQAQTEIFEGKPAHTLPQ